MAMQTEAEVRQMFKVIDESGLAAKDRPKLLFMVVGAVETQWAIQEKVDPAFREKQAIEGGLFGKPVAVKAEPVADEPVKEGTVDGSAIQPAR